MEMMAVDGRSDDKPRQAQSCLPEQMFACLDAALELVQAAWRDNKIRWQNDAPDRRPQVNSSQTTSKKAESQDIRRDLAREGKRWNELGIRKEARG